MAVQDIKVRTSSGWVSLEGAEGPEGTAATVDVGTTTTTAPGGDADVTNVGSTSAAVLNFEIPRGSEGPQGTAATLQAGAVDTTTGAAGTDASVVINNTGSTSAAVFAFDFTIPQGAAGKDGSGVTITGSINYVGPPVPPASDGAAQGDMIIDSDGDGWVYDGTSWSNVGPIRGPDGPPGSAATVSASVDATDTLGPGTNATASVVNAGTAQAAQFQFSFGIPEGEKGDTGANGADGKDWEVYEQPNQPSSVTTGALWIQTV